MLFNEPYFKFYERPTYNKLYVHCTLDKKNLTILVVKKTQIKYFAIILFEERELPLLLCIIRANISCYKKKPFLRGFYKCLQSFLFWLATHTLLDKSRKAF